MKKVEIERFKGRYMLIEATKHGVATTSFKNLGRCYTLNHAETIKAGLLLGCNLKDLAYTFLTKYGYTALVPRRYEHVEESRGRNASL